MGKISRVRTGCWTCKKRHKKCDEAKPYCDNCIKTNRKCEGYGIRLSFSIHDNKSIINRSGLAHRSGSEGNKRDKKSEVAIPEHNFHKSERESSENIKNEALGEIVRSNVIHTSLSNIEQLGSDLFEDLEYLLNGSGSQDLSDTNLSMKPGLSDSQVMSISNNSPLVPVSLSDHESSIVVDKETKELIDKSKLNFVAEERRAGRMDKEKNQALITLSYEEENMMLKHFFKKLLPLLDAHPNSPWPDLALKYCDFNIARSCFISLACIHIYESRKGGNEYYRKGMAHISQTMDYLIQFIGSNNSELDISDQSRSISREKQVSSFVVLVLVNVHILFAVLEQGKSSFSRFFLKVFASICQNQTFFNTLMASQEKRSLVVVLSWYDTVSAIVSPDCRLPYCSPSWYGSSTDAVSTSNMMGCPGEIFKAMSKVCLLRHDLKKGLIKLYDKSLSREYNDIKRELFKYRDYVAISDSEHNYNLKLKGAQCWALAVLVSLERTLQYENWKLMNQKSVWEFIDVYGSMNSTSPIVTQMVWPVYAIGCECRTASERKKLTYYMDTLYENSKMGTLCSLKTIVEGVWERSISQEEVLEKWLDDGVDYLPL